MDKGEKQRREDHQTRLNELREKLRKKVAYYQQKPYVSTEEFYHLAKEFFLELLGKEYEPTYEEIIDELEMIDHEFLSFTKKQRATVKQLLLKLSEAHYSNRNLSDEESREVLAAFNEVVHDLTTNTDHSIDHVLHRGLLQLKKGDSARAREEYLRARAIFEDLSEQEQQQYHQQLQELFTGVKDA